MNTLQAENIAQVKTFVEKALAENKRPFCYLFASREASTGASWCPDCRNSDPIIHKAIAKVPNAVLIEIPTGDRQMYHYY
jgi:thiol-disulfide isomerase/thioredoxin